MPARKKIYLDLLQITCYSNQIIYLTLLRKKLWFPVTFFEEAIMVSGNSFLGMVLYVYMHICTLCKINLNCN